MVLLEGLCDVYLLSCTAMPLPNNEPINIAFVKSAGKYKCLYDIISPQYNKNAASGRIIKIFFITIIFRVWHKFASH